MLSSQYTYTYSAVAPISTEIFKGSVIFIDELIHNEDLCYVAYNYLIRLSMCICNGENVRLSSPGKNLR